MFTKQSWKIESRMRTEEGDVCLQVMEKLLKTENFSFLPGSGKFQGLYFNSN